MMLLQNMQQVVVAAGHDLSLLIVGIILIIIGALGRVVLPQGDKGWWALILIGIVVAAIWLILLLIEIAA